ncbi:heat shock protein HtpX [Microvirga flocculans]|uniref:Heat shock protein HtpX n=1 Tax=Microvirga flocculans TaxID=217168 RepID=A0A7W6N7H7_9HYPH|nr:M48 family metallopeptidase [Microvirga flocculans]MBB4039677.1 heat shock protein HtpX [Microvirga flocculans]
MLSAFGLYTHIQANRRRSALLIAGLFLLFYLMTFGLALLWQVAPWLEGGTDSFEPLLRAAMRDSLWIAPAATALAGLWVWCGLRFNTFLLNLTTGSSSLERAQAPRLYDLLENLCISRGMTPPRLRILETEAPNAFASGTRAEQYTITVTRGLIDLLDDREMEAVLAHELTHIRNEDVRTMVIAVLVVGIFSFIGEFAYRWLRDSSGYWGFWDLSTRRKSRFDTGGTDKETKEKGGRLAILLIAALCIAVAWQLSLLVRFALSRRREYLADAGAVELTKNPDAMIGALTKIQGKGELANVPSGVMELCLDNPRSGWADLFATHPSIEKRIDALVRYAGGHTALAPKAGEAA